MEQFRGQLTRNGQVVIDHVEGRLDIESGPGGATYWAGYFSVPPGQSLGRDEQFELLLGDGRSNRIRIERVNQTAAGITVSFGRG
jgi:hypothetical protein